MRKSFENAMYNMMLKNKKVVALVADSSTGEYETIAKEFPDRIFDFGIAENNMVTAGCALAREGLIPVVYTLNNFLAYRSYEFIRNDACLQKRNIKFVGLGCGVIANTLGPTHHTTEDISCLRVLPNLTLLSPASPKEVPVILEKAVNLEGPVYIRLGKAFEREIYDNTPDFEIGKANIIKAGSDISIFTTGSITADAKEAVEKANEKGINAELVNFSTLKPIDKNAILNSARKTKNVLVVEEHNVIGGLGAAVSEVLCGKIALNDFYIMGFNDTFCNDYGWHQDLKRMYGLSPEHIYNTILKMAGAKINV